MTVTYQDVIEAQRRITPHVHRTPVVTSRYINETVGASVFFKCENLQKVGAFKARGATNAVLSLSDEQAGRGVVTHSSGNHGQAVAYACAIRGVPATIVVPDTAPSVKVDAMRGYGATIEFAPQAEREIRAKQFVDDHGMTLVHPFNDRDVIAGQGTAALELYEDVDSIDIVLTPIGGGGLAAGSAIVAAAFDSTLVAAEPELVDDAYRSLRDGKRYPSTGVMSVGDGLLTGLGELTFEVLSTNRAEVVVVAEEEIIDAMRMIAIRMKLVVEPSGATVVAALLRYPERFAGKRIGAIFSGGNVDLDRYGDSANR
jgi:threonine dehydratase